MTSQIPKEMPTNPLTNLIGTLHRNNSNKQIVLVPLSPEYKKLFTKATVTSGTIEGYGEFQNQIASVAFATGGLTIALTIDYSSYRTETFARNINVTFS